MKTILFIYNWLRQKITLPSAFSWQTLIVLFVFSWYMAWLSTFTKSNGFVANLLANFGWIFLILGVYWATTSSSQLRIGYKEPSKPGFPLSPWITGALVSMYLFGFLGNETGEFSRDMLIYWPMMSAIIYLIPDYLGKDFTLKIPPPEQRKNQVIIFATQVLLSCWFQFHFLIQDYVAQYPSVVADDLEKSAFVVKWTRPMSEPIPRGALILDTMEPELRKQLNGRSWPVVEKLLLPKERKILIDKTLAQAKQRSPVLEDDLWVVTSNASQKGSGYNLDLRADWQGPRSKNQPYLVTKNCQITQVSRLANAANKPLNTPEENISNTISSIECQPRKGWGEEKPIIGIEG